MSLGDMDGADVFGAGGLPVRVSPVFAVGFAGVGNRQKTCSAGEGVSTRSCERHRGLTPGA